MASRCCYLAKAVLPQYVMGTTSTPRSWLPYQDALHRDIGWSWVSRVSGVSHENSIKSQAPTLTFSGCLSTISSILFQRLTICYNGTESPYLRRSNCSGTEARLFCADYTWSTESIKPDWTILSRRCYQRNARGCRRAMARVRMNCHFAEVYLQNIRFLAVKGLKVEASLWPNTAIFKDFIEYYTLSQYGRINELPTVHSILTVSFRYVGYRNRTTQSKLDRKVVGDVSAVCS